MLTYGVSLPVGPWDCKRGRSDESTVAMRLSLDKEVLDAEVNEENWRMQAAALIRELQRVPTVYVGQEENEENTNPPAP